MKKISKIFVGFGKYSVVLLLIGLGFFMNVSYSQDLQNPMNGYDLQNAEGYISVEKNGVVKYFIVVSNGNGIGLIPVKENPAKILKSVKNIVSDINDQGGNANEKLIEENIKSFGFWTSLPRSTSLPRFTSIQ